MLLYRHGVVVASFPIPFILLSVLLVVYLSYSVTLRPAMIVEQLDRQLNHSVWFDNRQYRMEDICYQDYCRSNIRVPFGHGREEQNSLYPVFIHHKDSKIWSKFLEQANYTRDATAHTEVHYNTEKAALSAEFYILLLSYILVFTYISLVMSKVDLVQSRFGIGLSACWVIFSSLFMSVGLWYKIGFESMLVPWEVLPFLVIALGVENTLVLTNAVVSTSLDLPVKERVGLGFQMASGRMFKSLAGEMAILLFGSLISIPALQEFCMFAAVSIVMDFFLQITFFIAVLSIDIRRLELFDLHKLNTTRSSSKRRSSWTMYHEKAGSLSIVVLIIIMILMILDAFLQHSDVTPISTNSTESFWKIVSSHSVEIRPPIKIYGAMDLPYVRSFSIQSLPPSVGLILVVFILVFISCIYICLTSILHYLTRSKASREYQNDENQLELACRSRLVGWKDMDVSVTKVRCGWKDVKKVFIHRDESVVWEHGIYSLKTKATQIIAEEIDTVLDSGMVRLGESVTISNSSFTRRWKTGTVKFVAQMETRNCFVLVHDTSAVEIIPLPSSKSTRGYTLSPQKPLIPTCLLCCKAVGLVLVGTKGGILSWTIPSYLDLGGKVEQRGFAYTHFPCPDEEICLLLLISSNVLAAGCRDGQVILWDLESGTLISRISGRHNDPITSLYSLSLKENLHLLAISCAGELVSFWEVGLYADNSTGLSRERNQRCTLGFIRDIKQPGCRIISGYQNCIVGARRIFLGVEWSWEIWIVDLSWYDGSISICRTIRLGQAMIRQPATIVASQGVFDWILKRAYSSRPTIVSSDLAAKDFERLCGVQDGLFKVESRNGTWENSSETAEDDEGWVTDTSDSDEKEKEIDLPVLRIDSLCTEKWGIAIGFSNQILLIQFEGV